MTVQANDSSNRLGWMLNDLANMPEARFVVLLAADGMSMAYSESVDRDTADSVAASASGFHSIGVALAPFCGGKDNGLRQVVGEFDDGYLFVKTAGANTLLAVATTAFADAGVVTHRMNELAGRLGEELASPARHHGGEGGARP
ncbi:Predicted regulator of Ras-like GTPase activity, Roadblock/LC7/MglB family [Streptomyces misionensis]|uniref:Predicted regulator of Ras-like GTPase activity, Roadblock/LC7/MglB family n=1 Tax=Streptomyces misionensis TaxID=67331 RepID=A0A1H4QPK8_9ACTN|nr:roadblock/LC7 domain-containing protein [Streptomyces misionensis]SEC21586.1 Predicted regulator of Ras-like GTPase activity, Roadblock/LC7/MglB family [Streptomyces misionensis]